ncbi:hypothetical protein [Segetibacter aerophilus]|uniref:Tetratricopeptide repeat protein n=1 Tax=Segetibacter aerophilus TaxID=670293 RepID=A0A512B9M4_9BACT|nr:hypothetical protein [Segetibacter aerophilus]GEO08639.1 hypothetical protein SAE01_11350 [Segetibacter aerophilus]
MNKTSEKVLNYLTGANHLDAVTVDDLQRLVAESPYFPVTQFLLAKKLKDENEQEYLLQVQKTALYFSNPYWLEYQLTEETAAGENVEQTLPESPIETIETPQPLELENQPDQEIAPNTFKVAEGNEVLEAPTEIPENATAVTEDKVDENISEESTTLFNGTQAAEQTASVLEEHLSPATELEVIELEEEMAGVTHGTDEFTEKFLEETGNGLQKDQTVDDEHDRMFQNIKAMLDASSEEADADTKNATIAIDPYYTIDYFASQGIKLELDQNPQDQLGQNLKKFTQWLRHMKKLGPEDATEAINRTETEADIQQIADSSNTVREVVTEAMASVLEKQGKKDKAIELYNKLSFLNPHKSAYFADKIKKLKGF